MRETCRTFPVGVLTVGAAPLRRRGGTPLEYIWRDAVPRPRVPWGAPCISIRRRRGTESPN